MSGESPNHLEVDCPWLSPQCRRIQADISDLTNALGIAALVEYGEMKFILLKAIREFRQEVEQHVQSTDASLAACARRDERFESQISTLRRQHVELGERLDELERELSTLDTADPATVAKLRERVTDLAEMMDAHRIGLQLITAGACRGESMP